MCMEDIRIGREKRFGGSSATAGSFADPEQIIGRNAARTHVSFVVSGAGVQIRAPGMNPLQGLQTVWTSTASVLQWDIDIEQFGQIVTGEFYAADDGSGNDVTILETYLDRY